MKIKPIVALYICSGWLFFFGTGLIYMGFWSYSITFDHINELKTGNRTPESMLENCGNENHKCLDSHGHEHFLNLASCYREALLSELETSKDISSILAAFGISTVILGTAQLGAVLKINKQNQRLEPTRDNAG